MFPRFHASIIRLPTWLALLLASLVTACGGAVNRKVPDGVWPWAPTEVALHKLSRFVERDGVEVLSLRIEFLDAEGDPVKFPGQLAIRVAPENSLNKSWSYSFDLSDLGTNARFWDHVTSTYRIEIEVGWDDPPLPNNDIQIRVSADSAETGVLTTSMVTWRGRS